MINKISVAICTHNGERYIAEQLNSILGQTYRPDEIVVGDDDSSDKTISIVKEVLSSSGIPYRIIEHKSHQGIRRNFETTFTACSGDVIFSCDQDDVWMPDKIETFLSFFIEGYSFVYSNSTVVDADRNRIHNDYWSYYGVDFSEITVEEFRHLTLINRTISGYNMAFTKELLEAVLPFPEHFIHDDWLAICSTWFGRVAFIRKPLTEYRVHGNNTSGFGNGSIINKPEQQGEEGKKRRLLADGYYELSPDQWFGGAHMYLASRVFYDRMKDTIDDEYKQYVEGFLQHREGIQQCTPGKKLKSIGILIREYVSGRYTLFRGRFKKLVRDAAYILVNKNRDYTCNYNIW